MATIQDLMADFQRSMETDEERAEKKRAGLAIGIITLESSDMLTRMIKLSNDDVPDDKVPSEFDYSLWSDDMVARVSLGMSYVSKSAERLSKELIRESERRLILQVARDNNIPLDSKAN